MKNVLGFSFAVGGAVLLMMCILFDRYRHRDPNFRKKLKERRQKLKKQHLPHYEIQPKAIDPRFREAVIINEIQIAEQLMLDEKMEEAIMHFARAISVCADPWHLLNCLRKTLPPPAYNTLIDLLVRMYGDRFKGTERSLVDSNFIRTISA